ncbi:MAG TPA: polysaccharide biosynthesis/export family protein [Opitutaceae bacterium]
MSRFLLIFIVLASGFLGWERLGAADAPHTVEPRQSYKLQPMDLIKVQVYQEPELEREVRVSRGRSIALPLIGTVDLKNRTVNEAEQLITDLYDKDYLVNPQINITVVEYAPRTVNILGSVNTPGSVPIPPERDLTLLEAIARCGGFSRLANRGKVSLTRTLSNGETENYTVNADQIMSGEGDRRWVMQNGDVVFVPERVL